MRDRKFSGRLSLRLTRAMHERISRVSAARPMFINGWIEEACGEKLARDDLDVRDPKALVNILDEPPNLAPSGFMKIVHLPPPERLVDAPPDIAPGDTIRIRAQMEKKAKQSWIPSPIPSSSAIQRSMCPLPPQCSGLVQGVPARRVLNMGSTAHGGDAPAMWWRA